MISCTITRFRLKKATINEIKKIFKFSHETMKEGILAEFLNKTINKAIKQKKATNLRMIKKGWKSGVKNPCKSISNLKKYGSGKRTSATIRPEIRQNRNDAKIARLRTTFPKTGCINEKESPARQIKNDSRSNCSIRLIGRSSARENEPLKNLKKIAKDRKFRLPKISKNLAVEILG
ncbi:MAG: hypothetical protein ACFFD4_17595 [Candidatus Odinarchaeota archaeon]